MTNPTCSKTGAPMHRDARPVTLTYKDESITFNMPGWYSDSSDESIHTGQDMLVSDRALNRLKARSEGLLEPEEIRHIRKKLGECAVAVEKDEALNREMAEWDVTAGDGTEPETW